MTHYYYLASDQKMEIGYSLIDFVETSESIPGFDYPLQLEIINGVEKDYELRELLNFIHNHTKRYEVCTVQIANLLNAHNIELKVQTKSKILLHEIVDPKQMLIKEGHLLTIKKVPVF